MPPARDFLRRVADAGDGAAVAGGGVTMGVAVGEGGTAFGGTMLGPPPSTSQPQNAAATASATRTLRPAPPGVRVLISAASDILRGARSPSLAG